MRLVREVIVVVVVVVVVVVGKNLSLFPDPKQKREVEEEVSPRIKSLMEMEELRGGAVCV